MAIKLGLSLPQFPWHDLSTDIVAVARGLEEIGYDSAWAFERLLLPVDQSGPHGLYTMPDVPWPDMYRNVPDSLTVLTTAAAVTSRLQLGTNVLVAPLHVPARLAKTVATLDNISGGRVIAGVGTGWSTDEYDAVAPRPYAERGRALDEFLDIAEAVWGPDPVEFHNDRYDIAPATFGPKPARHVPILLGGSGAKALDRVARRADGWLPVAGPADELAATLARIREKAEEYGRKADEISCTAQVLVQNFDRVESADRTIYTGDPSQLAEDVAALAEAGAERVFLACNQPGLPIPELLDRAAELYAAVREAGI